MGRLNETSYSGPFSRIIDAVEKIAAKFDVTVKNTGNRLADNLEAIADADIGDGGSGALIVHVNVSEDDTNVYYTLDKTWREIFDADQVNIIQEVSPDEKTHWVIANVEKVDDDMYSVVAEDVANDWMNYILICTTENSYPTCTVEKIDSGST